MRLPYVEDNPVMATEEDEAIVQRVKQRRGGQLIELDKALLHAPQLADGWNSFLGAVRTKTTIPASVRELIMCRVAVLNQAWYEWDSHSPLLRQTGVISDAAMEQLKDRGKQDVGLDEKHAAVLAYADAMTLGCIVPKPVFEELKRHFNDREVVEVTGTTAAYNCVSRFLVALDVGEMAAKYNVDMH